MRALLRRGPGRLLQAIRMASSVVDASAAPVPAVAVAGSSAAAPGAGADVRLPTSSTAFHRVIADASARVHYVDPVPKDIFVSQSVEPVPITDVAEAAGILPKELLPYGATKAKVSLDVLDRLRRNNDGACAIPVHPRPLSREPCAGMWGC